MATRDEGDFPWRLRAVNLTTASQYDEGGPAEKKSVQEKSDCFVLFFRLFFSFRGRREESAIGIAMVMVILMV